MSMDYANKKKPKRSKIKTQKTNKLWGGGLPAGGVGGRMGSPDHHLPLPALARKGTGTWGWYTG